MTDQARKPGMQPPAIRITALALMITGAVLFLSAGGSGPYAEMMIRFISCALACAGLFLYVNPSGTDRFVALSLGIFAFTLMGTVIAGFESGHSVGQPFLDISIALFLSTLGISTFATVRGLFRSKKVPGLDLARKFRD